MRGGMPPGRTCRSTSSCDGTKLAQVTRLVRHRRARYCESRSPPGAASSSLPLQASEWNSSWTDASKLMGAFCRNTSPGPSSSILSHKQGHLTHTYLLNAPHITPANK